MRSHSVRHLLKSTLLVAGCAPYAADHILGHYPRDGYERQAVLYPEAIRREYSKASDLLNIFTRVEGNLGKVEDGTPPGEAPGPRRSTEEDRHRETLEALREISSAVAELRGMIAGRAEDVPGRG